MPTNIDPGTDPGTIAHRSLPTSSIIAAVVQLLGLSALAVLTTIWAWLMVAFGGGQYAGAALLVILPAPIGAAYLATALARALRHRDTAALIRFETVSRVAVALGALALAALLAILGRWGELVPISLGLVPLALAYLGLATAVIVSTRGVTTPRPTS